MCPSVLEKRKQAVECKGVNMKDVIRGVNLSASLQKVIEDNHKWNHLGCVNKVNKFKKGEEETKPAKETEKCLGW